MIVEPEAVAAEGLIDTDLCIVGAGPVGITLALTLAERGRQVWLIEAGRQPLDPWAQTLYAGETDGSLHSPPDRFRMRGLGGSSIRWGGRCMPLDPIDFERRPWVAWSGWPLHAEALAPYWAPATAWAEAGAGDLADYDARTALPGLPPLIPGFESTQVHAHSLERFSCPTDFGRRYQRRLARAPTLRVLSGAVCTAVRLRPNGRQVGGLDLQLRLPGRWPATRTQRPGHPPLLPVRLRAQQVVLALGGLETARLLLASDDVAPQGVGNEHDVVGRFYMGHLAANLGQLVVAGDPAAVRHGYERGADGVYCRRRLTVDAQAQRARQLLNTVARLHFPTVADPAHGSGILSLLYLARGMVSYEYGRRLQDPQALAGWQAGGRTLRHAAQVVRDAPSTMRFLAHWVWHRECAVRKFPSVILPNRRNHFSLEVQAEQVPHPDSRVRLSRTRDTLGQPRLRIGWQHQPQDLASVAQTLDLLAAEFARTGAGQLHWDRATLGRDLLRYGVYGGHHLGTARMGADPRSSVVDANGRVHGIDNLYIAGSAVFPTSSQANPTLTALALALRLADHLEPVPAPARPVGSHPPLAPCVS